MISEQQLADAREHMTLAERVAARAELDRAAGISYPPLSDTAADHLAGLLNREDISCR